MNAPKIDNTLIKKNKIWRSVCRLLVAACFVCVIGTGDASAEAVCYVWDDIGSQDASYCNAGNLFCNSDPQSYYRCYSNIGNNSECIAAGWTEFLWNDGFDIFGYPCSAPVPELEEYAAAAFLVLALTIGWYVRRKNIPAS